MWASKVICPLKIKNQMFLVRETLPAFHVGFHSKEDFSGEKFSLLPNYLLSFSRGEKETSISTVIVLIPTM